MKKNNIISLLIVYILNMYDGWAVSGVQRYIISILLLAAITLLLNEIERILFLSNRKMSMDVEYTKMTISEEENDNEQGEDNNEEEDMSIEII